MILASSAPSVAQIVNGSFEQDAFGAVSITGWSGGKDHW
jgi:hypothetical protein